VVQERAVEGTRDSGQQEETRLSEAIRMSEAISKAPDQYRNYYVPVFKQRCDGTPYHVGTAFGFEHQGRRLLLTALHVLDRDANNACDTQDELYLVVAGVLQGIGKFTKSTVKDPGMPHRLLDLAIIEPLDYNLSAVFRYFFTAQHFYRARPHPHLYAAACGFPSKVNRISWRNRPLKNRPVGYFGKISPAWKLRLAGFSSLTHFGIDIDLRKTFTRTQREVKAPKPHGISGGPVFVVFDFHRPSRRPTPLLRGLVIESAAPRKCLICVDLQPILSTIYGTGSP
jgi:hypothetical protein